YSAMNSDSQRKPLYSVWKPATSSLSASARSNGARLQLAVAQVKYSQKAANVNGSWKMYQFQKNPPWRLAARFKFMVPATMTGMTTQMPIGTWKRPIGAAPRMPPNSDHLLPEPYPARMMPKTSVDMTASM